MITTDIGLSLLSPMHAESSSSFFGSRKSGEINGVTAASSTTTDDIVSVIVVISIKKWPPSVSPVGEGFL